MIGAGLEEGRDAEAIAGRLLEEGLIVNVPEPGTLRLLPPLIVADDEVEKALDSIRLVLAGSPA